MSWRRPRAFALRLHVSAAPPRVGLTQALEPTATMPDIPTPDFDDPKEIYAFFGLAAYAANLLESSLINWATALRLGAINGATRQDFDSTFEHFEAKTLGQLIVASRSLTAVPANIDVVLRNALAERNRLIHRFFREHAANNTHPAGQRVVIGELCSMIELFQNADTLVTPIYLSLWKHFGIDEAMIQRELEETLRETETKYSGL